MPKKPDQPTPAAPTTTEVQAVTVVRPATCAGTGQAHEWRWMYGYDRRTFLRGGPPDGRLERFHCTRCPSIEDRELPPFGQRR